MQPNQLPTSCISRCQFPAARNIFDPRSIACLREINKPLNTLQQGHFAFTQSWDLELMYMSPNCIKSTNLMLITPLGLDDARRER